MQNDTLLLVGNPNVGKSALFGKLTGKYVTVSNYPGTTVDVSHGKYKNGDIEYDVIDSPGIYSLLPQSEDEIVTRDLILEHSDVKVLLVLDARNLQRGLVLAHQLSEMKVPFCVALNMMDEAAAQKYHIDINALITELGVPVVATVATIGRGIKDLHSAIANSAVGVCHGECPVDIETTAAKIADLLGDTGFSKYITRFLAIGYMVEPGSFPDSLKNRDLSEVASIAEDMRRQYSVSISSTMSKCRQKHVTRLLDRIDYSAGEKTSDFAVTLGRLSMHPVYGGFMALVVLWLVYQFVGVFGAGVLVNFIESKLFDGFLNPLAMKAADLIPFPAVRDFLVGDYGIVTMALTYSLAIILPVVGTFFIAFGVLEDSGYMPRLAVMANKLFRKMGLHGKAVLPMILGLGCDTMATLTARIMDTKKERILVTLLLALGVPCSAQLAVIFGMLGSISVLGLVIWIGVVSLVMFVTGSIASRILPGESSDFILELPPIRKPGLMNIIAKTGSRVEWYLKEAVPLFILGTVILFALDRSGVLVVIRDFAAPVVQVFLGLPEQATDAFLIGFLRRDYGAAGLLDLQQKGLLDGTQVVVSLIIITLFVPCIANFFVMIKERGLLISVAMSIFIVIMAVTVGGLMNFVLTSLSVVL
ncbi:ferrous iron transport protein B [bacterium]|nr:ferrous iron transport protein B [bacterium]